MQYQTYVKVGIACALAALLGSCDMPQVGSTGFQSQYVVARNALEGGDYARSGRVYAKLVPEAGPLTPRIKIEYAHSHLRAGNYAAAVAEAAPVARSASGDTRSAALAVQGTAQHELALAALAAGDTDAAKRYLSEAKAALSEVLKNHPKLDPLAALAGRAAQIEVQLSRL